MAKQAVSLVERHVEKGVVALTFLVLLVAVILFLIRSPNTIKIEDKQVDPAGIYDTVRSRASKIRQQIQDHQPKVEKVENPLPKLQERADLLAYARAQGVVADQQLTYPVPFLPPVPKVGRRTGGEKELAPLVAPTNLQLAYGRSTIVRQLSLPLDAPELASKQGSDNPLPPDTVNWVTVSGLFDVRKQQELCEEAGYEQGRLRPYLIRVDLQRRQLQPNGSWPEQWEAVNTYAPYLAPAESQVTLEKQGGQWAANDISRDDVRWYFGVIKAWQADLIRPLFPGQQGGDPLHYPPFSLQDLREMDLALGYTYERTYPEPPAEEQPDTESMSKRELEQYLRDRLAKLLEGHTIETLTEALEVINQLKELVLSPHKQQELTDKALEIEADLETLRKEEAARGRQPDGTPTTPTPSLQEVPQQLAWAHDCLPGSVQGGATYQYRMRLVFYNRFAAAPRDLKNPEDAKIIARPGPWSSPSEPVSIPRETRFFVTTIKGNPPDTVRVHLFKRVEGEWIDHKTYISVGQPIGGTYRIKMPSGQMEEVQFDTGAILVAIDPDHPLLPPNKDDVERTAVVVYADAQGHLYQRLIERDKDDPEYKELRDSVGPQRPRRVQRPPRKQDEPQRPPQRGGSRRGGGGGGGMGGL